MLALINLAAFWIALCGLLFILYGPWQEYWTEWARQRLFESRDRIFDLAAAGNIKFSDKRYTNIRSSYNRLIRFAHRITWPRLITYKLMVPEPDQVPVLLESIDAIDDQKLRHEIERELDSAMRALVIMLFMRSPVLWIPFFALALIAKAVGKLGYMGRKVMAAAEVDAENYEAAFQPSV